MRNWSAYIVALALLPAIVGFGDVAGQSSGIARTLAVLLAAIALFAFVADLLRRRS